MISKFFTEHPFLASMLVTMFVASVGYFEHRTVKDPMAAWTTWFFGALTSAAAVSGIPVQRPWNWGLATAWFVAIMVLLMGYLKRERKRRFR